MRATKLQELEQMAATLLATTRKLPPGPDRQKAFQSIERFRLRIAALKSPEARPALRGLKVKK